MKDLVFELPIRISVSIGEANATSTIGTSVVNTDVGLERVDIDQNYQNRKGYDPTFLGVNVPIPVLGDEQRRNAAKNSMARQGEDATVLPYHHFSVVMNRRRQLAYYTAVNIDGSLSKNPERSGDKWYFDPRIAQSEQIGGDLYVRNDLDRGHLVRRLDPAWGNDAEALVSNNDTFHFTNCSPQHSRFNQNSETWQGIENHLLNKAKSDMQRMCIFTGPVMSDEDPLYRGVRLPLYYWKIAAFIKPDNQLSISAYLLDQVDLIAGLERFEAKTFQVKVEEIALRTGLNFSPLIASQVDFSEESGLESSSGENVRLQLNAIDQIIY